MALVDRFKAAEPFIVGIGVPLAVLLAGAVLPVQFAQQASIAKIEVKVDDLEKKVDGFSGRVDKLNEHLTEGEADPSKLLSKLLGKSSDATVAMIAEVNGKLYALPRTQAVENKFVAAGFKLEMIAPTVQGFAMPPVMPALAPNPSP